MCRLLEETVGPATVRRDFARRGDVRLNCMHIRSVLIIGSFALSIVCGSLAVAEAIAVRYLEGSQHGYLALRSLDGKLLAAGDVVQTAHGSRLTSRLTYHFKDGSLDDETAVFTQNGHFRLVSDHRVQKGPSFPKSTDVMINALAGEVTVRYLEDGKDKVDKSHMYLPDDLANGLLLDVVKNISARDNEVRLSYLAATPKPRVVHLSFTPDGIETFYSAGLANRAQRYKVHVELGGLAGVIAPMIGKEPADSYIWVSVGQVPAFIRAETPLYLGGPQLLTELISPVWRPSAGTVLQR
jgi:hypothetical protein